MPTFTGTDTAWEAPQKSIPILELVGGLGKAALPGADTGSFLTVRTLPQYDDSALATLN